MHSYEYVVTRGVRVEPPQSDRESAQTMGSTSPTRPLSFTTSRQSRSVTATPLRTGSSRLAWTHWGGSWVVVFTWRDEAVRLISARKATRREREQYEARS